MTNRLAAFVLIVLLALAGSAPAYARTHGTPADRAAQKEQHKLQKAWKKQVKQQQKAYKKELKREAKRNKQNSRTHESRLLIHSDFRLPSTRSLMAARFV